MMNYNIQFWKNLIVILIFPLFIFVLNGKSQITSDLSVSLKLCWEQPAFNYKQIASDNELNMALISESFVFNISPDSGEVIWKLDFGNETVNFGQVVNGGLLVLSSGDKSKFLTLVDLKTGLNKWRKDYTEIENISVNKINSIVLLQFGKSKLAKLNLIDGTIEHETVFVNEIVSISVGTNEGYVLTSKKELFAFDSKLSVTKEKYFSSLFEKSDLSILMFGFDDINEHLIFKINARNLLVYSILKEKIIWKRVFGGEIVNFERFQGTYVVSSMDNFLYFYDFRQGKLILKRRLDGRMSGKLSVKANILSISTYNSYVNFLYNLEKKDLMNIISLSDASGFVEETVVFQNVLVILTSKKTLGFSGKCKL